ncbi:hypothetical protein BDV23DRAFT_150772 [Aspergillus alliaceus]|uniref:Uncharacterized protein n=1 Tax=Petromyces alliaceus TaxID=209559 RepID=A0A5N7CFG5_PETAA|nr:hypothetical protein BDV23DRAFT_150772 [Aspergillus alliaceus]
MYAQLTAIVIFANGFAESLAFAISALRLTPAEGTTLTPRTWCSASFAQASLVARSVSQRKEKKA